jgi:predicted secreted hydrolase
LPAQGSVQVGADRFQVEGNAWMDREWSTSALAPDQVGWDWFALQLDDGRDLMFYQLRDSRGAMHPYSAGVIVGEEGLRQRLSADQVRLEPLARWRSPDGRHYPIRWSLRTGDLDLTVSAEVSNQEHRGNFRYWEGAVRAEGRAGAARVSAVGYLEMTGY